MTSSTRKLDREIDQRIDEFLDQNLAELQADRGHALAPQVRDTARKQIKLYWRRLRDIAQRITDTEVRLGLTGQVSPSGRPFAIEGIVDIVRDESRTVLYDVKTHAADGIRENKKDYTPQLNVYAHIWQTLRGEPLDETAIICTECPPEVLSAFDTNDQEALQEAFNNWDPLIPIEFNAESVTQTVKAFGKVVDRIENHEFEPRPAGDLRKKERGLKGTFAVTVCRNCDARFSCASYRLYALGSKGSQENRFRQYIEDLGDEEMREDFILTALETTNSFDGEDLE